MSVLDVFEKCSRIDKICQHGWADAEKAIAFASTIFAIRPELCVEIGTYGGRSAIPVLLALRELRRGVLWCIDPWSPEASAEGQPPEHAAWWSTAANHEMVYNDFQRVLKQTMDAERFGPRVRTGGFACLDDLNWPGGGVVAASQRLNHLGFVKLYDLGSGAMFQKIA